MTSLVLSLRLLPGSIDDHVDECAEVLFGHLWHV